MELDLAKLYGSSINEEYIEKGRHAYLSQLSLITIKSLVPSYNKVAVSINYERFIKEMDLWLYYRDGANPSLLNIKRLDKEIYWKSEDDSLIYRLIPLIIANQELESMEDEIIKNILFTSGNIKEMFKYLSISYLIYIFINKGSKLHLEGLKERLISFSQVKFLEKYGRYYRLDIKSYPNNFQVEFERSKIELISYLNGIPIKGYEEIKDLDSVFRNNRPQTKLGNIVYKAFKSNEDIRTEKIYSRMGEYLVDLRKSKIEPKNLQIDKYDLPDIFSFDVGEEFFHSLLNYCKILKKETKNNNVFVLVASKTGRYLFRGKQQNAP